MSERSHLLARTAENLAYAHVKVNILSLRMGRNISRISRRFRRVTRVYFDAMKTRPEFVVKKGLKSRSEFFVKMSAKPLIAKGRDV
jgi:hypothetical protein